MKVLVCGGRKFDDHKLVFNILDKINRVEKITEIINGGAKGADTLGRVWARTRHININTFDADWNNHGNSAGPIRNERMLKEGAPDLLVAFPGGPGTRDMIMQAKRRGVPIIIVDNEKEIRTL